MDVPKENTAHVTGNYESTVLWREIFNLAAEE